VVPDGSFSASVPPMDKETSGLVVPTPTLPEASTTKPLPATANREAKRLVLEAVVEKKFVVVAFVPVALVKRKSGIVTLLFKVSTFKSDRPLESWNWNVSVRSD
jgi:hypothetical protein